MTSIQHNDPDESIQPLPEDHDPPFSPPTSPVDDATDETFDREIEKEKDKVPPDHQVFDSSSNIDQHEAYDAGEAAAAEAGEPPNAGDAVVDYDPEKDQRKQDEDQ